MTPPKSMNDNKPIALNDGAPSTKLADGISEDAEPYVLHGPGLDPRGEVFTKKRPDRVFMGVGLASEQGQSSGKGRGGN